MYKDFSNWTFYDGFSFGSGTSQQDWITNPITGEIGLFKDRKNEKSTDNFSEKIASDIANIINLPAAKIDLAKFGTRIGMVSYKINSDTEDLIEGISYISSIYPEYNRDTLIDEASGEYYNLKMILDSISTLNLSQDLFKVFIFDFIIGNTDRHHSNWAIIKSKNNVSSICPVYDNTSSLCGYENDDKIIKHIKDNNWIKSLTDNKSVSIIRLDGTKKKKPKHSEFIKYLKDNYYNETIDFILKIKEKLTESVIDNLMDGYTNVLSGPKITIIKIFLKEKLKLLFDIYDIK